MPLTLPYPSNQQQPEALSDGHKNFMHHPNASPYFYPNFSPI